MTGAALKNYAAPGKGAAVCYIGLKNEAEGPRKQVDEKFPRGQEQFDHRQNTLPEQSRKPKLRHKSADAGQNFVEHTQYPPSAYQYSRFSAFVKGYHWKFTDVL